MTHMTRVTRTTRMTLRVGALWLLASAALAGCGVGERRMLLATTTSLGLVAETTPRPGVQMGHARVEAVVAPVFAGGATPPSVAGITVSGDAGLFGASVGSAFAVGDAALTLTEAGGSLAPVASRAGAARGRARGAATPRPVVFLTDTTVGIGASWGGLAGPAPDRAVLGYARRAVAIAPVAASREGTGTPAIAAPSLIATVTAGGLAAPGASKAGGARVRHQQFFATGEAATRLGRLREVRASVFRQADTGLAEAFAEAAPIECADELAAWLDASDAHALALRSFLDGLGYERSAVYLMETGAGSAAAEAVCAWLARQRGEAGDGG